MKIGATVISSTGLMTVGGSALLNDSPASAAVSFTEFADEPNFNALHGLLLGNHMANFGGFHGASGRKLWDIRSSFARLVFGVVCTLVWLCRSYQHLRKESLAWLWVASEGF
ncbi:hypothetical protein Ancab_032344 [Ancistrocladus abbreviatus]